jgi:REP element-mobilizing transposase RayT
MERNGRSDILLHFVWSTLRRMPLISPGIEDQVYACMLKEVGKIGCELLAVGGMEDHVHLAVRMSTATCTAELAKRVKGSSSKLVRRELAPGATFGWQDGYGVYSFSRSHRDRVTEYVRNQKRHHSEGRIWSVWEPGGVAPESAEPRP